MLTIHLFNAILSAVQLFLVHTIDEVCITYINRPTKLAATRRDTTGDATTQFANSSKHFVLKTTALTLCVVKLKAGHALMMEVDKVLAVETGLPVSLPIR